MEIPSAWRSRKDELAIIDPGLVSDPPPACLRAGPELDGEARRSSSIHNWYFAGEPSEGTLIGLVVEGNLSTSALNRLLTFRTCYIAGSAVLGQSSIGPIIRCRMVVPYYDLDIVRSIWISL